LPGRAESLEAFIHETPRDVRARMLAYLRQSAVAKRNDTVTVCHNNGRNPHVKVLSIYLAAKPMCHIERNKSPYLSRLVFVLCAVAEARNDCSLPLNNKRFPRSHPLLPSIGTYCFLSFSIRFFFFHRECARMIWELFSAVHPINRFLMEHPARTVYSYADAIVENDATARDPWMLSVHYNKV